MDILSQEKISSLASLLGTARKVAVVGHTHPDGDALGCTFAMALWLRERYGAQVAVLFPDTPPQNLQFLLDGEVPCLCQDVQPVAAQTFVEGADVIVLLDCNAFSRTEGLQDALGASKARKVLIDHHLNPDTASFDLVFSTPDISSASELLFWILKELGWQVAAGSIGEHLLAGMTTDTNSFANSVWPSTFQMASQLIAAGIDRDAILRHIYQSYRENRVRVMGYMQHEGLHILPGGGAYMILTRQIQQRFDIREGETEGLVNVPLSIGEVRLSVLLKEDDGVFRVSVRSKKGTSAQQLAQRFFHGGGHENAAGGKLFVGQDILAPEAAAAYLEDILSRFLS